MSWTVAVAGTLHRDDITTPAGGRTSLGGSAVYCAVAASRLAPVRLLGITGADTAAAYRRMLRPLDIDISAVTVSETPTLTWHAVHDFERWVTTSERSDPGCDDEWQPQLDAGAARAEVLFLGSMKPRLQVAVREQSAARLTGCDTMTVFTEAERGVVGEVVRTCDVVFLNRAELRSLTQADDWRTAAASLLGVPRPRAVVVKSGPEGAAVLTASGVVERAAVRVPWVVDPTGAGDALAGGFLGHCAAMERDDEAIFAPALDEGVRCAAAAITSFGLDGLLELAGAPRPPDV